MHTEAIADAEGNIVPAETMGLPAGGPTITEVTVELHALGDRTRVILTHAGLPPDSPGASGWQMALDKLVRYIETR